MLWRLHSLSSQPWALYALTAYSICKQSTVAEKQAQSANPGLKSNEPCPAGPDSTRAHFAIERTIAFGWQAGFQLKNRSIRTSQVNGVLAFVRA